MPKQQINIKLPPSLIEVLRERAASEEITLTNLIQRFCEQGLGLPPSNDTTLDTDLVYERILAEVENRIATKVDECISASLVTPLAVFQSQIRSELQQQVDAHISKQLADTYEQISKMLQATQASLDLRIREAVQQVAVSPEALAKAPAKEEATSSAISREGNQKPDAITPNTRLKQFGLAQRFGHFNPNTGKPDNSRISRKQAKPDFEEWSREHDPEKIGWNYDAQSKLFSPVIDE